MGATTTRLDQHPHGARATHHTPSPTHDPPATRAHTHTGAHKRDVCLHYPKHNRRCIRITGARDPRSAPQSPTQPLTTRSRRKPPRGPTRNDHKTIHRTHRPAIRLPPKGNHTTTTTTYRWAARHLRAHPKLSICARACVLCVSVSVTLHLVLLRQPNCTLPLPQLCDSCGGRTPYDIGNPVILCVCARAPVQPNYLYAERTPSPHRPKGGLRYRTLRGSR